MKAGGRRELIIPPSLGYGAQSPGAGIAANDTLVFVDRPAEDQLAGSAGSARLAVLGSTGRLVAVEVASIETLRHEGARMTAVHRVPWRPTCPCRRVPNGWRVT